MFIDLITNQLTNNKKLNLEIVAWGAAPASPHLLKQIKEVLKPKIIKVILILSFDLFD